MFRYTLKPKSPNNSLIDLESVFLHWSTKTDSLLWRSFHQRQQRCPEIWGMWTSPDDAVLLYSQNLYLPMEMLPQLGGINFITMRNKLFRRRRPPPPWRIGDRKGNLWNARSGSDQHDKRKEVWSRSIMTLFWKLSPYGKENFFVDVNLPDSYWFMAPFQDTRGHWCGWYHLYSQTARFFFAQSIPKRAQGLGG